MEASSDDAGDAMQEDGERTAREEKKRPILLQQPREQGGMVARKPW